MKKLLALILWVSLFFVFPMQTFAVENPLATPNNKIGIHILFPSELQEAAKLINSNGGDWGYVTIPIQAGDKNLDKWQSFMDQARSLHLIPIIRLATEGDYFNTQVWRKPNEADILDFANFLNSLNWPTKNKFVIIFNEVNRGDEWGGAPSPQEYADLLSYAVSAFKSKSPDFFIISSGMDNAAANTGIAMNEYNFFQQMNVAIPGIFNQVDGIASHSYPNPGFAVPPTVHTQESITSFAYEKSYIQNFESKDLPVFITETGWSRDKIPDNIVGSYFQTALNSVWNDPDIVAITPFLLRAGGGPFTQFSFLDTSGNPSSAYNAVYNFTKTKGQPTLNPLILSAQLNKNPEPVENFSGTKPPNLIASVSTQTKSILKWFLGL